jgi:hypothetical protein
MRASDIFDFPLSITSIANNGLLLGTGRILKVKGLTARKIYPIPLRLSRLDSGNSNASKFACVLIKQLDK